jgi:hypothetical protein
MQDDGWSNASSLGFSGSNESSFDGSITPKTSSDSSSLLASSSDDFEIGSSQRPCLIRRLLIFLYPEMAAISVRFWSKGSISAPNWAGEITAVSAQCCRFRIGKGAARSSRKAEVKGGLPAADRSRGWNAVIYLGSSNTAVNNDYRFFSSYSRLPNFQRYSAFRTGYPLQATSLSLILSLGP